MRRPSSLALTASLVALAGCAKIYPAPNIVDRPRVLTLIATPVVVPPGDTLTVRPLLVGGAGTTIGRWSLCVPPRQIPSASQPQACFDTEELRVMGPIISEQGAFAIPADMDTLARWVFMGYGTSVSPAQIFPMVSLNGLDMIVTYELDTPAGLLRASKRVLLTITGATPPTSTVPGFRFAGARWVRSETDLERCVPESGGEVSVAQGDTTTLQPDPLSPTLLQFADGGDFELGRTRADVVPWTAPRAAARVAHWLIAQRNAPRSEGPAATAVAFCRFEIVVP